MGHVPKKTKIKRNRTGSVGKPKRTVPRILTQKERKIVNLRNRAGMLDELLASGTLISIKEKKETAKELKRVEDELDLLEGK